MNKKEIQKSIKYEEKVLRKIFADSNILLGVPNDEFDCLIHQLLSALYKGDRKTDIKYILKKQLSEHFGIIANQLKIKGLAQEIYDTWFRK